MKKYPEKTRFGLRLDSRIKRILEQLADLKGISSSSLVRLLILQEKVNFKEELLRKKCYNGELEI